MRGCEIAAIPQKRTAAEMSENTMRNELIKAIADYWQQQATDSPVEAIKLSQRSSRDPLVQAGVWLHAEGDFRFTAHGIARMSDQMLVDACWGRLQEMERKASTVRFGQIPHGTHQDARGA
jgi:hypothetical protein